MGKPHKHAEMIKAWAEGHDIEVKLGNGWLRLTGDSPHWDRLEYRIKPEKVYPVTLMGSSDLELAYRSTIGDIEVLRAVANAAIRHAIDSGQVVLPTKEGE